jgi:hypothetical protein
MDVCTCDEPPVVGDEERFATCWYVQQQQSAQAIIEEVKQ